MLDAVSDNDHSNSPHSVHQDHVVSEATYNTVAPKCVCAGKTRRRQHQLQQVTDGRVLRRGRCRGTQTLPQRRPEPEEKEGKEEEDDDRNVVGGCPGGDEAKTLPLLAFPSARFQRRLHTDVRVEKYALSVCVAL